MCRARAVNRSRQAPRQNQAPLREIGENLHAADRYAAARASGQNSRSRLESTWPFRATNFRPNSSSSATRAKAYSSNSVSETMPLRAFAASMSGCRTRPAMRPFSPERRPAAFAVSTTDRRRSEAVRSASALDDARVTKRPPRLFNSFVYLYNICTALGQDHCRRCAVCFTPTAPPCPVRSAPRYNISTPAARNDAATAAWPLEAKRLRARAWVR